jgi:hypothetical protein
VSADVGRYRKVYPRVWRTPTFTALAVELKLLVVYVLTGPQQNRIGLSHFSVFTAAEDLGATPEQIGERLHAVCTAFGWHYDAAARVLFIPSWWTWNQPENPNVLKNLLGDLAEVPPSDLLADFARNIVTLRPTLRGTFRERMAERSLERYPEPINERFPERMPHQEQEQEREQEPSDSEERIGEHARAHGAPRVVSPDVDARKLSTEPNSDDNRSVLARVAHDLLDVGQCDLTDPPFDIDDEVDLRAGVKAAARALKIALDPLRPDEIADIAAAVWRTRMGGTASASPVRPVVTGSAGMSS